MADAVPVPSIVARILEQVAPKHRAEIGQIPPKNLQFLESLPPSTPELLAALSPDIRDGIAHNLLCGYPEEASASLYFLTAPATAKIEQMAFAFSQSCANLLNRTRHDAERISRASEILPPGSVDAKKSIAAIREFLRLFCIDDGQEARPLQPQTALAKLRENPEPYRHLRTTTYSPHSLLDMMAEDGCGAHYMMLELLEKEYFEKQIIARQPGRHLLDDIQAMHWLSGRRYDQFAAQLAKDMVGLIHQACELRNACLPQIEGMARA